MEIRNKSFLPDPNTGKFVNGHIGKLDEKYFGKDMLLIL